MYTVDFMKASDALIARCREREKTEDSEKVKMYFLKLLLIDFG